MKYLLIDISNSFTKLAFSSSKRIGKSTRIPTAKFNRRFLQNKIDPAKRGKIDMVVVSSVVPTKTREIKTRAKILLVNAKTDLGVGVDYPKRETIGADRLANAAAVAELFGWPAIVVDFGTAVTFDIVSEDRQYIGGVIAPGLESMTNFLYQRTALLPKLSLKEPRHAIGRSTIEAMRAGAIFGYRGLVREILRRIIEERFARKKVRVIATGGYAALIAKQLPEIEKVSPNLTLEGLRIVANRNAK